MAIFFRLAEGSTLSESCRINGRVSEYMGYTERGENDYLSFPMGFVISLYSSVGLYFM